MHRRNGRVQIGVHTLVVLSFMIILGMVFVISRGYPWFFLTPPFSLASGWYGAWIIALLFLTGALYFLQKKKNHFFAAICLLWFMFTILVGWHVFPWTTFIFQDPKTSEVFYVATKFAGRTKSYSYTEWTLYERKHFFFARKIDTHTEDDRYTENAPIIFHDEEYARTYEFSLTYVYSPDSINPNKRGSLKRKEDSSSVYELPALERNYFLEKGE